MSARGHEHRTKQHVKPRSDGRLPDIGSSLRSIVREMHAERGRAREFRRALHRGRVPMLTVTNDRAMIDANLASRLLLRLSLAELRSRRIDDLIEPREAARLPLLWERLLERGELVGIHELSVAGCPTMRALVLGLANILPGEHLIVLAPADWPGEELADAERPKASPASGNLSTREREVLALVAAGDSLREIAEQLAISVATVRTHLGNANRKLGARNRAHAVAMVLRHGLIGSDEGSR